MQLPEMLEAFNDGHVAFEGGTPSGERSLAVIGLAKFNLQTILDTASAEGVEIGLDLDPTTTLAVSSSHDRIEAGYRPYLLRSLHSSAPRILTRRSSVTGAELPQDVSRDEYQLVAKIRGQGDGQLGTRDAFAGLVFRPDQTKSFWLSIIESE